MNTFTLDTKLSVNRNYCDDPDQKHTCSENSATSMKSL